MTKLTQLTQSVLLAAVLIFSLSATPAQGQAVSLSPEQQRMLDQLPPSQRDAAMRQLRQFAQRPLQDNMPDEESGESAERNQKQSDTQDSTQERESDRFHAGSTALLVATAAGGRPISDESQADKRTETIALISKRNPYRLDQQGRLLLPGFAPIELAGLNQFEAGLRVNAEAALEGIDIQVFLLPLQPSGLDALRNFGYDLFEQAEFPQGDSYAIPVPADYVIGPGDSLRIQLFGNRNAEYELQVERDGTMQFPEIGPMQVGGLSFDQLRTSVRQRVAEKLIGTQASVSMGELRLVQVFLVGDVKKPGSYTVGALSTITSVLSAGGGVAENGSLRRVQLKRGGRVVSTLDVYDLLLRGDTSGDSRVQAGDVVFVPPVGTRIAVSGEVKRPAIYEYKGAATVADIVALAGGLSPRALASEARIERLDPSRGLLTIDTGFDSQGGQNTKVNDGDTLRVPAGVTFIESSIQIVGNVQRPGNHQWRPGLRLSDAIPDGSHVLPGSDLNYVLIRREPEPNVGPTLLSADLAAAWQQPHGSADVELQPRDSIYVFDIRTGREQYIDPLIDELQLRSSAEDPLPVASIGGSVNAAGRFPLENGMRVSDLIRAGGGLAQSAFSGEAELTRLEIGQDGVRKTSVLPVDLAAALRGDLNADLLVAPFDYLIIRETPNWRDQEFVEILGEVAFPGKYPIRQGESLTSVIRRAGGLTRFAFPRGSVFTRETLKEREREQIEILANRMESDLASLSLSDPSQSEALGVGQALLQQLRSSEPVGRLVIDLSAIDGRSGSEEILVRGGDALYVPPDSQEVTVLGEVQYSTSHVYDERLTRSDYIQRSGGTTAKADDKRIYVVRASGEVIANRRSMFFRRTSGFEIMPGDTIVVPLDTDRVRPLTLWTNVTQILYNLAIAARAASGF